jgi:hypothetical protein
MAHMMAPTEAAPSDFHQRSYERHAEHWKVILEDQAWRS